MPKPAKEEFLTELRARFPTIRTAGLNLFTKFPRPQLGFTFVIRSYTPTVGLFLDYVEAICNGWKVTGV